MNFSKFVYYKNIMLWESLSLHTILTFTIYEYYICFCSCFVSICKRNLVFLKHGMMLSYHKKDWKESFSCTFTIYRHCYNWRDVSYQVILSPLIMLIFYFFKTEMKMRLFLRWWRPSCPYPPQLTCPSGTPASNCSGSWVSGLKNTPSF